MTKKDDTPFGEVVDLMTWQAEYKNALDDAVSMGDIRKDVLGIPDHIDPDDLDGRTFVIVSAKQNESNFLGQDHYYFCTCVFETGEIFTTIMGGSYPVAVLDKLVDAGMNRPLKVTLIVKHQGKYGKYYVLE